MSGKLKNTRAAVGHQTDSGVKLKHSSGGKRSCSTEAWSYNSKHRFPSSFMSQRCCQTSLLVSVGGACRCTSACWLDASALKVCEKFRVRWCNACSRVLLRDKVRWKLLGVATLLPSAGLFLFEDKHCQHLTAGPQKSSFPQMLGMKVYCSTWRTWIILLELKENWTLF